MKTGAMNDLSKSNIKAGMSILDCIRTIKQKYQLTGEEIFQIYALDDFIIKKVFMTQEGSFNHKGEYTADNIPGFGKICIQYIDNDQEYNYLILQKIDKPEKQSKNVLSLYKIIENNIRFFEKADRASNRIFFQSLFKTYKKQYLQYINKLNIAFERSYRHRKTDEVALSNAIFILQRQGKSQVIAKAVSYQSKMLSQINTILKTKLNFKKRRSLVAITEELKENLSELHKIQNLSLLH